MPVVELFAGNKEVFAVRFVILDFRFTVLCCPKSNQKLSQLIENRTKELSNTKN